MHFTFLGVSNEAPKKCAVEDLYLSLYVGLCIFSDTLESSRILIIGTKFFNEVLKVVRVIFSNFFPDAIQLKCTVGDRG